MLHLDQTFIAASPAITKFVDVPPGPCSVVISVLQSGAAVSVGSSSTATTSTNGFVANAGQSVTINQPVGASGVTLYGVGIGGTAIISTAIAIQG
jgi:hypothetical protein